MTTADEYMMEAVDGFEAVSKRFLGVDLQFRRTTNSRRESKEAEWPCPWRLRLVRAGYRITVFGDSLYDAIAKLRAAVEAEDRR